MVAAAPGSAKETTDNHLRRCRRRERCHGARRRASALARRPVAILVGAVIAAGGIAAAVPLLPAAAAHAGTQTGGGLAGYNVKLTGWPGDEAGMSVANSVPPHCNSRTAWPLSLCSSATTPRNFPVRKSNATTWSRPTQ